MRASRKGGVAISPFLSLRGFPKESRGNLYTGLLRRFAPRNDNEENLSVRGFPMGSRGNLFFNGMYHNPSSKNEIATPERFSVQARNDKKVRVACSSQ